MWKQISLKPETREEPLRPDDFDRALAGLPVVTPSNAASSVPPPAGPPSPPPTHL